MFSYPPEWFNIARILEFPESATKEVTLQAILDRLNTGIPISSASALTDAQLRASPVPVTGPLTNAQLRSSAVAVSSTDKNVVSVVNSTVTLLAAGATFTGIAEDVSAYNSVVVAVKTDKNGTYTVQFSSDAINWDSTLTRYFRTNSIEPPHRFTITRKYVRVTFTNTAATAQTYLRLQTMYGEKSELNIPLDSMISQDFDSISVRPTEFHTEVALDRRQGATTWNKFGYNLDVDIGTEIVASWGGTFQFLTAGETISIVSTSANDDSGGTGVNSIVVYGIDANWNTQTVVYTMDGAVPVVSAESWIGINRVAVFLSGAGRTNAGDINITASVSLYQMAQMPAGIGVSQQLIYYAAVDHKFLLTWVYFNVLKPLGGGAKPEMIFLGQVYSAVNNTIQEVYRGKLDVDKQNELNVVFPLPFAITEKTILYFTATSDVVNVNVSGRFSGELIRDVDA